MPIKPILTCEQIKQRDFLSIARLISGIERQDEAALAIADELYLEPRFSHIIGITGLPGAGKSTLVSQMVKRYGKQGNTLAILAIDPTSPFTGGAVLGDRVRLQTDDTARGQVFFRSLASRGQGGGISAATSTIVHALNAARFNLIIIETVGAGQLEVDIAFLTDTLINVLTPEAGDDIQAMKAGLMEIGNIFVINKSDLPGADRKINEIQMLVEDSQHKRALAGSDWQIPVLKTRSDKGEGLDELLIMIDKHRTCVESSNGREQIVKEIQNLIISKVTALFQPGANPDWWQAALEQVQAQKLSPRAVAEKFLSEVSGRSVQLKHSKDDANLPGLVHLYTGPAKGKTTAALGLALRAAGHGKKVLIIQFMKGRPDSGELNSLSHIPQITVRRFGSSQLVNPALPGDEDRLEAGRGLEFAREAAGEGYDVVVLDEIVCALDFGLLDLASVLALIRQRPPSQEMILTGRQASSALIEIADYVTSMQETKHPYTRGVPARPGIEF